METLLTEWDKFEGDLKDEFVNISVLHETIPVSSYNQNHGTVLEISHLKSEWDRKKFLDLKNALAKLINPNTKSAEDVFTINITVKDEIKNDLKETDSRNKVNGEVENLIFEALDLKTTKIVSKFSDKSNSIIESSLFEGGKLVYKITEKNTLINLHDVEFVIYFLNRSAKYTFSRRMGMPVIEYGHVFMYKNGLRIFPYGERGEDPFKMDNRKTQGYSRYLGTREVIGYISIEEPNNDLRETSSRGDGLIKTKAYVELVEWFYTTLRRLEKYGIDIIDWGNELSNDDFIKLDSQEKQNAIKQLVLNLTKSVNIESFEVSPEIFQILEGKQEKSAKTTLTEISKKLEGDNFNRDEILKSIKNVEHKIDRLKDTKEDAENEAFDKMIENEELSEELDREIAQNLFTQSLIGTEKEDLISLQHQIVHTAGNVSYYLNELVQAINNDSPKEELIESIQDITFEVQRIVSSSRYVTKAGFNKDSEKIKEDIVQFINEYIENLYVPARSFIHQERPINIIVKRNNQVSKMMKFRPFEFTVLLDNLFTNSRKAKADEIQISWSKNTDNIILHFKDNGIGIPSEYYDDIFKFGFSRTDGSGIGLYMVKNLISKYKGTIEVNSQLNSGTEFLIKLPQ